MWEPFAAKILTTAKETEKTHCCVALLSQQYVGVQSGVSAFLDM